MSGHKKRPVNVILMALNARQTVNVIGGTKMTYMSKLKSREDPINVRPIMQFPSPRK